MKMQIDTRDFILESFEQLGLIEQDFMDQRVRDVL